jgi:transposase-like protein
MMKCPECGLTNTTEIQLNLKDEDSVKFYSCRKCEAKWWERDGDSIELDEVLSLTAEQRTN